MAQQCQRVGCHVGALTPPSFLPAAAAGAGQPFARGNTTPAPPAPRTNLSRAAANVSRARLFLRRPGSAGPSGAPGIDGARAAPIVLERARHGVRRPRRTDGAAPSSGTAGALAAELQPPSAELLTEVGRGRRARAAARYPAGTIALYGAAAAPPTVALLAEELNCVYSRQNCTCNYACPCEHLAPAAKGDAEGLYCGCEVRYNCTCEIRSGACVLGPPDDAYLHLPGPRAPSPTYLAVSSPDASARLNFASDDELTLEIWARPEESLLASNGGKGGSLLARLNNGVAGQWVLRVDGQLRAVFQRFAQISFNGGRTVPQAAALVSAEALPAGSWTHVAATFAADGSRRLYLNGSLAANDTQRAWSATDRTLWTTLGASLDEGAASDTFAGEVDDARVWRVARTADDIERHRAHRLSGYLPKLAAYWRCDHGEGRSVPDMSGGGAHLAAVGRVQWRLLPKLFGPSVGWVRASVDEEAPLGLYCRKQDADGVRRRGSGVPFPERMLRDRLSLQLDATAQDGTDTWIDSAGHAAMRGGKLVRDASSGHVSAWRLVYPTDTATRLARASSPSVVPPVYTHVYWLRWDRASGGGRTLFRTRSAKCAHAESGSLRLGAQPIGGEFAPSNYSVPRDVEGWQMLAVRGAERTAGQPYGASSFYVGDAAQPPSRVGETNASCAGEPIGSLGGTFAGPGLVGAAWAWDRHLSDAELAGLHAATACRYA